MRHWNRKNIAQQEAKLIFITELFFWSISSFNLIYSWRKTKNFIKYSRPGKLMDFLTIRKANKNFFVNDCL